MIDATFSSEVASEAAKKIVEIVTSAPANPIWLPALDEVRTYFLQNLLGNIKKGFEKRLACLAYLIRNSQNR
jgi:hypothetical protein